MLTEQEKKRNNADFLNALLYDHAEIPSDAAIVIERQMRQKRNSYRRGMTDSNGNKVVKRKAGDWGRIVVSDIITSKKELFSEHHVEQLDDFKLKSSEELDYLQREIQFLEMQLEFSASEKQKNELNVQFQELIEERKKHYVRVKHIAKSLMDQISDANNANERLFWYPQLLAPRATSQVGDGWRFQPYDQKDVLGYRAITATLSMRDDQNSDEIVQAIEDELQKRGVLTPAVLIDNQRVTLVWILINDFMIKNCDVEAAFLAQEVLRLTDEIADEVGCIKQTLINNSISSVALPNASDSNGERVYIANRLGIDYLPVEFNVLKKALEKYQSAEAELYTQLYHQEKQELLHWDTEISIVAKAVFKKIAVERLSKLVRWVMHTDSNCDSIAFLQIVAAQLQLAELDYNLLHDYNSLLKNKVSNSIIDDIVDQLKQRQASGKTLTEKYYLYSDNKIVKLLDMSSYKASEFRQDKSWFRKIQRYVHHVTDVSEYNDDFEECLACSSKIAHDILELVSDPSRDKHRARTAKRQAKSSYNKAGGRPRVDKSIVDQILEMRKTGMTIQSIVDQTGVSKSTIKRYLKK